MCFFDTFHLLCSISLRHEDCLFIPNEEHWVGRRAIPLIWQSTGDMRSIIYANDRETRCPFIPPGQDQPFFCLPLLLSSAAPTLLWSEFFRELVLLHYHRNVFEEEKAERVGGKCALWALCADAQKCEWVSVCPHCVCVCRQASREFYSAFWHSPPLLNRNIIGD